MPELNPITRKRLLYITVFLAMDALIALYVSWTIPAADAIAMWAVAFGLISGTAAGALGAFLFATREVTKNLHAVRSRE